MTRPLPATVFNAASAMPSDRRRLARQCLRAVVADHRTRLVVGVECDDLTEDDLREILSPGWWWRHRGGKNLDGLLVAGQHERTSPGGARWFDGAPASPVNDPRPILRVRIAVDHGAERWSFTAAAMHMPREDRRAVVQNARDRMVGRSHAIAADVLAGDLNMGERAMRNRWPERTVKATGVIGALGGPRVHLREVGSFDMLPGVTGDDHRALRVLVSPRGRG